MLFTIFVIVLVGVIVYFHYLQGFFSSALSAAFAVIAAIVAVSYHETVITMLLGGRFADQAHAGVLVGLFAAVYIVLRVVFDQLVPGNLRFPLMVERIGAPVMGLIAAIFAVGVLVIAAQAMPVSASVIGYARYPVTFDKGVTIRVEGMNQSQDAKFDEVDKDKFTKNESNGLLIPVDDLVLKMTSRVSSESGSLSNGKPLASVHPDYLQELFGQRIGLQPGSRRVATTKELDVMGVFTAPSLPQFDQESHEDGGGGIGTRFKSPKPKGDRKPEAGHMLLIVRVRVTAEDADLKTNFVALSPGSVRLVARTKDGDGFRNYFPIGTLEGGKILFVNQPDDYLFVPGGKAADFVFEVEEEGVLAANSDPKSPTKTVAEGVFVEAKRMSRGALGGKEVLPVSRSTPEQLAEVQVLRKTGVPANMTPGSVKDGQDQANSATPGARNSPLAVASGGALVTNLLFSPINVGSASPDSRKVEQDWGEFDLIGGKFAKLMVNPVRAVRMMAQGNSTVNEFWVTPGQAMIQVTGRPQGGDKWAWATNLADFTLADGLGRKITPMGAVAKVKNAQGQDMMVVRYDAQQAQTSVPSSGEQPTEVTLLYVAPAGTDIKAFEYKNELVLPLQINVTAGRR